MSENPYLAPQTFDTPLTQHSQAELIRQEHIKTEASIKSIGILYYLGSIAIVIAAVASLSAVADPEANHAVILGIAVLIVLGILQFFVGMAVRKFKPWSRIAVGIFSGIGLLGFQWAP